MGRLVIGMGIDCHVATLLAMTEKNGLPRRAYALLAMTEKNGLPRRAYALLAMTGWDELPCSCAAVVNGKTAELVIARF